MSLDTSPQAEERLIEERRLAAAKFNQARDWLRGLNSSSIRNIADFMRIMVHLGTVIDALDVFGDRADDLRQLYKARCEKLEERVRALEAELAQRQAPSAPSSAPKTSVRFRSIWNDLARENGCPSAT